MKSFLLSLAFVALFAGCASHPDPDHIADRHGHILAGDSTRVTLGMSRLQVMQALGRPENTTADVESETLTYDLERPWWQDRPFRIVLKNDKVISFGVVEKP